MAQLRHDYLKFKALNTEALVMVPNGPKTIARYIENHAVPYPILCDKGSRVAESFGIDTKRLSLLPSLAALKPSVFLVGTNGQVLYTNYTTSYVAEPDNREPLAVLARLTGEGQSL